jgi:hypothetical protein
MVENLRDIIDILCEATCMELNIDKSIISFWGRSKNEKYVYSQVFPFQILALDDGMKYMGFH